MLLWGLNEWLLTPLPKLRNLGTNRKHDATSASLVHPDPSIASKTRNRNSGARDYAAALR